MLDLSKIQPYMFSIDAMKNIGSIENTEKIFKKIDNIKSEVSKLPTNLWVPPYQDKLFWCFYYIKYGEHEYAEARKYSFRIERETKIAAIEILHNKKDILKRYGFKLAQLESDLVTSKFITYKGLYALCIAYELSILYVKNRTYMKIDMGNNDYSGLIITKDGTTGLRKDIQDDIVPSKKEISDIEEKLYIIMDPNKPIRAISAYGLQDLITMATKLDVTLTDENGKKKLKKNLYEDILVCL